MTASSPPNFLQFFPLELRQQIYRDIFAPTGYIMLRNIKYGGRTGNLARSYKPTKDDKYIVLSTHPYKQGSYTWNRSSDKNYSNSIINLSILRTCKQIHIEAKGFLFRENILDLEASAAKHTVNTERLDLSFALLPDSLTFQLQHIHLNLNLKWHKDFNDIPLPENHRVYAISRVLSELKTAGNLKTVQLNVQHVDSLNGGMGKESLLNIMHIRATGMPRGTHSESAMMFQEYLRVLKKEKEGTLKGMQVRLMFEFADLKEVDHPEIYKMPDGFNPVEGFVSCKRRLPGYRGVHLTLFDSEGVEVNFNLDDVFREKDGDPNEVMMELHEALGGELYVGPRLCYKDGIEYSKPWHKITVPWRKKPVRDKFEGDKETFHILLRCIGECWYGDENGYTI